MRATRVATLSLLLAGCTPDYTDFQKLDSDPPEPVDTEVGGGLDQPDILVTPEVLNFGALPPNCAAADQVVTIENVGTATLEVDPLELKGAGNTVYTFDKAGPFTLAPGDKVKVKVGFLPATYAHYDDVKLVVTSNDPDRETVRVALDGEGAVAAFAEEVFLQEQADSVDVLWVIDNSCSMEDNIASLGRAIGGFINQFVLLGLDYRMGVTTTDVDSTSGSGQYTGVRGRLTGPVIDGSTVNPTQAATEFKSQIDQGSAGSADEKGFAAAMAAVNGGYFTLRDEATFAVVVLSDEDDRNANSELGGTQTPRVTDDFVAWLQATKDDPNDASFSGMVCPPSGGGLDGACPQYNRAIRATNGVYGNINDNPPDFDPFLVHLSFAAAGLEFEFELSQTPTNTGPTAITVEVDGQPVPYSPIDGWTYDAEDNSIVLWGDAIPDPGEEIYIRYPYDAGCL